MLTLQVTLILIYSIACEFLSILFAEVVYQDEYSVFNFWAYGACVFIRDLTFNLQHWIQAAQYAKVADEVPRKIEGLPESASEQKK